MALVDACLIGWLAAVAPAAAPSPGTDAPGKPEALPQAQHDEARARAAWEKGAKAFAEGRLSDAIEAFEETYRYSGRSGPMFSLGQAHRHLWEAQHDHTQRELAIRRYQQYIKEDPEGRRVLEAERWIAELSKFDELEDLGEPKLFTRLSLSSPVADAIASIDGGAPVSVPETLDVAPGSHDVVVSAPGFHPLRRTVDVPEGSLVPMEFALAPREAMLTVKGPAGAVLYVDGERVARLPTKGAVPIAPGFRQIGVAQRGRSLYVRNLELGRGEAHDVTVQLEPTGQRKIAYAAIGVGSAATVASIALMGVALDLDRRAKAMEAEKQAEANFPIERQRQEQRLIDRRDTLRTAAIATGVMGLAVLGTGILLHLLDRPPVASQLHRPDARPRAHLRVAFGFAGAGLGATF